MLRPHCDICDAYIPIKVEPTMTGQIPRITIGAEKYYLSAMAASHDRPVHFCVNCAARVLNDALRALGKEAANAP